MFLHVFTGWDMVLFYAPKVLTEIGFQDTTVSFIATLGLGMVFLLMTIFSLWIVDRVGRRPMAISGLGVMAVCLGLMAALTVTPDITSSANRWALVGCLAVFVGAFALTLSPVADVIVSEIYPQVIRGPASSLNNTMRSLFAFTFSLFFPMVLAALGMSLTFMAFMIISAAGAFYLWRQLPETKGKSLEEIADYWSVKAGSRT